MRGSGFAGRDSVERDTMTIGNRRSESRASKIHSPTRRNRSSSAFNSVSGTERMTHSEGNAQSSPEVRIRRDCGSSTAIFPMRNLRSSAPTMVRPPPNKASDEGSGTADRCVGEPEACRAILGGRKARGVMQRVGFNDQQRRCLSRRDLVGCRIIESQSPDRHTAINCGRIMHSERAGANIHQEPGEVVHGEPFVGVSAIVRELVDKIQTASAPGIARVSGKPTGYSLS